jgi:hypothetical protein
MCVPQRVVLIRSASISHSTRVYRQVPTEELDNSNEDFVASSKRIATSTILVVLLLSWRFSDVLHSFDAFPTIEGGVRKKHDGKVKRSAPSVNGVPPRVTRNTRGLFFGDTTRAALATVTGR